MTRSTDQIKKQTRGSGRKVEIQCLGCGRWCKGVQYDDHTNDPYAMVISAPLSQHLNTSQKSANSNKTICFQHYRKKGWLKVENSKVHYNFTKSNVKADQGDINVRRNLGLPAEVPNDYHRTINNHTIYRPGLRFEKPVVESLLFTRDPTDNIADFPSEEPTDNESDSGWDVDLTFNDVPSYDFRHTRNCSDGTNGPCSTTTQPNGTSTEPKFVIDSEQKLFTVQPSNDRLKVEVDLMNIMTQHKMPLAAFDSIWKWAYRSQTRYTGFSFSSCRTPRKRETVISDICKLATKTDTDMDRFQQTSIKWLPSNKEVPIYVRDFRSVLRSLLTNKDLVQEENLSFPDPKLPYIWKDFPEPSKDTEIRELHHGHWWVRTWKDSFELRDKFEHLDDKEVKDVLVPVIFYMDGISLDARGRLSLMPLNMTLGVFSTEARKRADAWETVYFQPNPTEIQIALNTKKETNPTEKCQNLHNGIARALESFFDACTGKEQFVWAGLPYGGKRWNVRMKFAIAYVVGDTEMHDQLCGRKKGYTNTNIFCRHCNVCPEYLVDPFKQLDADGREARLWTPADFEPTRAKCHFDAVSHHRIKNAFDRHYFGSNPHKIHLATPGELLHMHQLGPAKRAVESYKAHINHELDSSSQNQSKLNMSYLELSKLAQIYGGYLARQSDRDFPRTKFSSDHILKSTMREASQYAGILTTIVLSLLSDYGKNKYTGKRVGCTEEQRLGLIDTIECILEMEEFLKKGGIRVEDLDSLDTVIEEFMDKINKNCKRSNDPAKFYGLRLIKTHLYKHVPTLMRYYGHAGGFDSSASESNHKVNIKAPSKNTQCRVSDLIKQTGTRQFELRLITEAARDFLEPEPPGEQKDITPRYGPAYTIFKDKATGEPRMEWDEPRRRGQPTHSRALLKYCVDEVLPLVRGSVLRGFTEHHRKGEENSLKYVYRAHPSYRSNVGLKCDMWYDWAKFNINCGTDENGDVLYKEYPGQINCFLEIKKEDFKDNRDTVGYWCVTREFADEPAPVDGCRFVKMGTIDPGYSLRDCDMIADDVAVVPNIKKRESNTDEFITDKDFFVVANRNEWLKMFWEKIKLIKERENDSGRKRKRG